MILCRKIKIRPVGDKKEVDRVYQMLRDGTYSQNKAYNILISMLYAAEMNHATAAEKKLIYQRGQRIPATKKEGGSLYKDMDHLVFQKNFDAPSYLSEMVKSDLKKAEKDGLYKGKISLPNRKLNSAMFVRGDKIHFYHEYESDTEFFEKLYTNDVKIYMGYVNKMVFEVILGNPHKSHALRSEFQEIFVGNYKVCGSSIQIVDKGIILNLSINIPEKDIELDENTIVGVDLGIAIPAVCALNNSDCIKRFIGSKDELLRVRTVLQAQRRRMSRNLTYARGGHGRERKMEPLFKLEKRERNFVQTYNHMISKQVVEFAIKNKAKYINLEDLSNFKVKENNQFVLRNWSYHELQKDITYKAKKYGIKVRKVNPSYTSQMCSCCGNVQEGQRVVQESFTCKNEQCGYSTNADFNAARNIAKSTKFAEN